MCCLISPAWWQPTALFPPLHAALQVPPPCSSGFISGAENFPTFFQKLEFLCLACCLLASTSSCFSWHGMEIVTRVSVLDLECTFPLQKC